MPILEFSSYYLLLYLWYQFVRAAKTKHYIIYSETDHQPRWDAWDKCSGLVHWEDPEESGGVGGGWGDGDGEHM